MFQIRLITQIILTFLYLFYECFAHQTFINTFASSFATRKKTNTFFDYHVTMAENELNGRKRKSPGESRPASGSESEDELDKFMKEIYAEQEAVVPSNENPEVDVDFESSSEEAKTNDLDEVYQLLKMTQPKNNLPKSSIQEFSTETFAKSFYRPVPSIAKLTKPEIISLRNSLCIHVRGKDVPAPVQRWSQMGLPSEILNLLVEGLRFERPTPIQAQAVPAVMSGRDVIAIAKTGSGKTLSFLLPLFRHVLDQVNRREKDKIKQAYPVAFILTPTRELAIQTFYEISRIANELKNVRHVAVYGGDNINDQISLLRRGCEIVVGTPGRIIDLMQISNGKILNARSCTFLVLDEADRMFDMGFEPQVMRIIEQIRPDRQTVMFSATFPRIMEGLARKVLSKPVEIRIGGSSSFVCDDVTQQILVIDNDMKFLKLLEVLGLFFSSVQSDSTDSPSAIVFCHRQDLVDQLYAELMRMGYPCLTLHGGMDQNDRDSTIADFKNGVTDLLIATSVASRGLDVARMGLVVNYDCPNHYEDYVHRCGRTGRAGNKGLAVTFVCGDDAAYVGDILQAYKKSNQEEDDDVVRQLEEMWEEYLEHMKIQGKEVVMKKLTGFAGRGYQFTQEEKNAKLRDREEIKWSLNMQNSDDEIEKEESMLSKIEQEIQETFQRSEKLILDEKIEKTVEEVVEKKVENAKLRSAQMIAEKLKLKIQNSEPEKTKKEQKATIQDELSAFLGGGPKTNQKEVNKMNQNAQLLAEKINKKLDYHKKGGVKEIDYENEAKKYIEQIDVDVFPDNVKNKICNRQTLNLISEVTNCEHVNAERVNTEDNKTKVVIKLESDNDFKIQAAKAEIKRILKEELLKDYENFGKDKFGRYKVV